MGTIATDFLAVAGTPSKPVTTKRKTTSWAHQWPPEEQVLLSSAQGQFFANLLLWANEIKCFELTEKLSVGGEQGTLADPVDFEIGTGTGGVRQVLGSAFTHVVPQYVTAPASALCQNVERFRF
ncbi:hypothetical protein [Paraburkholderia diazotrophica]|uniref:hypothetical protein n=1 Tax=Paraburkholderia diazotrophica TaxID=667676 RepID=UPI00316EBC93